MDTMHALHQRPHPRRHRRDALRRQRAGAGQPHPQRRPLERRARAERRDRDRRRRRDADARHVRGAHALLVERRGDARRRSRRCRSRSTCCGAPRSRSATSRPASPRASAPPAPSRGSTSSSATRSTPGQIPGPRYLAASQEITVARRPRRRDPAAPAVPRVQLRRQRQLAPTRCARRCACSSSTASTRSSSTSRATTSRRESPAETTWMSDDEVAAAMDEVRVRGKRGTAHARSAASVKQALRHGIDVIYHASYSDNEALDMLEAAKDRVFVAPGIAILLRDAATRPSPGASRTPRRSRWATSTSGTRRCESLREDAQARHPRPARRRLRLRVDAALPERARPRVLRQVPRLHADGGDPLGHALRRPDHDEARRARRRSRTATSPTCCWSTATRSPTSRSCATRSGILAVMKDGVVRQGARDRGAAAPGSAPRDAEPQDRCALWLLFGGPIAVFSVWAIVDNAPLYLQDAAQRPDAGVALLPRRERLHAGVRPDAQRQPRARLALPARRLCRLDRRRAHRLVAARGRRRLPRRRRRSAC